MPRTSAGSPKARNLGAELRKAREDAQITGRELAQKVGINRPRLQRWEAGTTVPSVEDVVGYLANLGINHGPERDRIVELARDVDANDWITGDVSGETELTALIEFERTCTRMITVSPLLIPGLLQTHDYIRAVMTGLNTSDTNTRVGQRLERQGTITKGKHAPQYNAFIGERVLRAPIGGCATMAEQLRHIHSLSTNRSNIQVQVLPSRPTSVNPAHAGPYVFFEFAKAAPIVHLEHFGSAAFLYGAREVSEYARAENTIRHVAMGEEKSLALIAEIASEMEQESE